MNFEAYNQPGDKAKVIGELATDRGADALLGAETGTDHGPRASRRFKKDQ